MTWEWSHTQEAYAYAQQAMQDLPRQTREVIAAEWLATPRDEFGGYGFAHLDLRKYHHSICRVKEWSDDKLDEFIWQRMSDLANCTNGGWEAHCCPHGCFPHMVPFGPDDASD
jgi:hypothetical protein